MRTMTGDGDDAEWSRDLGTKSGGRFGAGAGVSVCCRDQGSKHRRRCAGLVGNNAGDAPEEYRRTLRRG